MSTTKLLAMAAGIAGVTTIYTKPADRSILLTDSLIYPMPMACAYDLALGKLYNAAIDSAGSLICFDKLGHETITVLKGRSLRSVKLANDAIFALDKHGILYQVTGDGRRSKKMYLPSTAFWFEKLVKIETGSNHLVGLTNYGRLVGLAYNKESNMEGQLGAIVGFNKLTTMVEEGVVDIAAGISHTLILKADGSAYGLGSNAKGQLSSSYKTLGESFSVPQRVKLEGVQGIGAGGNTSYFKNSEGVFSAGEGLFGQLGSMNQAHARPTPMMSRELTLSEYIGKDLVPIDVNFQISSTHAVTTLQTAGKDNIYGKEVLFSGINPRGGANLTRPSVIEVAGQRLQLFRSQVKVNGKIFKTEQTIAVGNGSTAVYPRIISN